MAKNCFNQIFKVNKANKALEAAKYIKGIKCSIQSQTFF